MRIAMLGINYRPEETGIAVYNTGRCEYLAGRGHDVTMYTGFPYYPWWRVPDAYRGRLVAHDTQNGVRIARSWLYVPSRVTTLRRMLHEASFVASATLRALGGRRPDLLISVSPPLGLALASVLLKRRWGVPYVFHVPDLQPDAALDLGMLRGGRLARALYRVERLAYDHAALVSTLTPAMRARILSKGIPGEKVALFSDWAEPALFDLPLARAPRAVRQTLGLDDRFLVVHAGNMGVKQGLDVVLKSAEGARAHPDVAWVLVGDGARRPALEREAATLGLDNVRFLPLQPEATFRQLLATTDVALVTQQRVVADIVFPSKVLTLLAAGRPTVASVGASSEVARVVREAGAGLVVPPEDPGALRSAVLQLRADPEARARMGAAGRAYARAHWDRAGILPAMEARLREVVDATGGSGPRWVQRRSGAAA